MKLTPHKLEGWHYRGHIVWCKFYNHNFNRFVRYTRVTDRRRDRRTGIACSRSRSSKPALCCQPVAY